MAAASPGGPDRSHLALSPRTGDDEAVTFQAGPLRRVVRKVCLDDAAALVACRAEKLLEQRVGHAIRVMVGIDHDQVHGSDVATGPDRGPESEDRTSDHFAPGLGDEDACLREVDQLSEQAA